MMTSYQAGSQDHQTRFQNPDVYAGIMKLANYFAPVHVTNGTTKFIDTLYLDERIAFAKARAFGSINHLPVASAPLLLKESIMLIAKCHEKWFPIKMYHDHVNIIRALGPLEFGGTKEEATHWAEVISMSCEGHDTEFLRGASVEIDDQDATTFLNGTATSLKNARNEFPGDWS